MIEKTITPWGELGLITFARTYSREKKDGTKETFEDTVDRELLGIKKQLKLNLSEEEIDYYKKMRLNLKGSVAGRFMWQLGTKTVDNLGLASLQNCAFVVIDDPIKPFTWAMDMLMLGSGVGYSIKKEHVYKLPKVKRKKIKIERFDNKQADFIVPDTREGWVKLLGKVLKAYFYSGEGFTYSTQLIRGKGEAIKGFGGVASGPGILVEGIELISGVLENRKGQQLRPIDCLDIMNIIGMIVVAGNVRRSAQIAIGDWDDIEFLKAKRWDLGNVPNWRAMSNNSIDCEDIDLLPQEFWETYNQGEPYGLINLALARKVGRLGETQYQDPDIQGFNPCQPEFATVLTPEGIKTFADINIGSVIWSKQGWTTVINKWSTGIKPVYESRTTGGVFIGTLNHRVDTPDGKIEVENANNILTIAGEVTVPTKFDYQTVMDGLFFGDGYIKHPERKTPYSVLVIGKDDQDYFNSEIQPFLGSFFQKDSSREEYAVQTTISPKEKKKAHELRIPQRFMQGTIEQKRSFIRGLYTADGSVITQKGNTSRVTYKTASKNMAQDVQLLLSSVGIRSYITTNKSKEVVFNNGTYTCKESYDVNITKDVILFKNTIGFIQQYKMDKIQEGGKTSRPTYTSKKEVNYLGDYEVFDITVDNDSHTYWTGGLSVSNCAEQSLANKETCCLSELFLPNIESKEELFEVAKLLYKVSKHSLALKCHQKDTQDIVHKNMRMGIGITGVMMAGKEKLSWLDECYRKLREFDKQYSKEQGFPESIKLTTVKPSGSLSLLAGVTPGVHPAPAGKYFIRRLRIASNSDLIDVCRSHGYYMEFQKNFDGTEDKSTYVVEFPSMFKGEVPSAEDIDVLEQLDMVRFMQKNWSDNSVSVTAYYKKEDLPRLREYLSKNWKDGFKTLSFLLYSGHGFIQAPYEPLSKEEYELRASKVKPITEIKINEDDVQDIEECDKGGCPIK